MTRKAFVVGHPIAHSRSPLIHGHWLKAYGIDGSYQRIDVAPGEFEAFVSRLADNGFVGGNVTIPHKEAVYRLVDELTPRAEKIAAVNTLVLAPDGRLRGDNTDALGFMAHLEQSVGCDWLDASSGAVTILGAGGATRAIVVGLLERGITDIVLSNRTRERAESLQVLAPGSIRTVDWADLGDVLEETGLLVNGTSLGMTGHAPLEIDLSALPDEAIVSDIVYSPLETPLLARARARELRTVDGLGMLLHQAVPGFEAWFGVRPTVTEELRALVIDDLQRP